jgi:3-hydroxybutyrate dehydrogenase
VTQLSLQGKRAIITGSTSGIGLGIAKAMAAQGVHVVINGFGDKDAIEAERSGLENTYGIKARYSAADMSKGADIRAMVALAEKEFGGVDILVNNAGIQFVSPIDEFPEEKWDQIIAINLTANFHSTKAVLPLMKAQKWGRIINIASAHGLVASAYKSAYVSAKHGVLGLTKTTALEVGQDGITCNAICPGYVNTPLVQKQIPEQAKAHNMSEAEVKDKIFLEKHAIKDFVEVEDLAALVLYLCSDHARMITGTALPVDAGWTAT